MFRRDDFVSCLSGKLGRDGINGRKGAGDKKINDAIKRFDTLAEAYKQEQHPDFQAYSLAMGDVLREAYAKAADRAKVATKAVQVSAQINTRLAQWENIPTGKRAIFGMSKGPGHAIAVGLRSLLVKDERLNQVNVESARNFYFGRWQALMADSMDHYGHGVAGRRKGKAEEMEVLREIFAPLTRDNTHNENARAYANGWHKTADIIHNDFNEAGGNLPYRHDYSLPQHDSPVRVSKMDFATYRQLKMDTLDWDRMRHPDGSKIKPDEYDKILEYTFKTTKTDGANRLDTSTMRGEGKALGDMTDHRFFVYKNADAWMQNHKALGNGTVFDTVDQYIRDMAHRTAMVQMFGRDPELMIRHAETIARNRVGVIAEVDKPRSKESKAVAQFESELKTFKDIAAVQLRQNAMDPESPLASGAVLTHDLLMSAQLGGMTLAAMPGDFAMSMGRRIAGHQGIVPGIGSYLKDFALHSDAEQVAAQTGFIWDSTAMGHYASERFSGMGTYGPAIGKRLSSFMMDITAANRHTNVGRWAPQQEMMGALYRTMQTPYEQNPLRYIMKRYGIDQKDWDAFRKAITPREMSRGVFFAVPHDIMNTSLANKLDLSMKFHNMVRSEGVLAVPDATTEAMVSLRGTSRPDTLPGLLLYSFSMYKNFPVTLFQQYGRLAMTLSPGRRMAFMAGLGVSMIVGGALTTQMKNLTQGKKMQPMDDWRFWAKAGMVGGSFGIWGDFLFSGVNNQGGGAVETAAGPFAGLVDSISQIALGDPFAAVDAAERGATWAAKTPAALSKFLRYYTPGSNIWYARLVLERYAWDRLDLLADPHAARKQAAKVRALRKNFNSDYWWAPGTRYGGQHF
jgi:hypothetical protein